MINEVVVVTGAAQGIGAGIAKAYAQSGAKVVLADQNRSLGMKLEMQLTAQGFDCLFIEVDVRDEQSVQSLMAQAKAHFGNITVLINNAGRSVFKNIFELSLEEWDDIMATNLRSVFVCTREAAKYMNEGGAIVSIASTRAFMSEPNSEAYAATKGGIIALTHALASSLAPRNITVNCISPGWIETGDYSELSEADHAQHFSGRVGKPEDIAKACLYLTDRSNNFITGQNITVDGGMTKKMIYE